ncbi:MULTISPECIES: GAF and ANTAR domain-containing protein [Streptomyces]|uniref:GAF and ANTAR domain-containing protein n=1 Tax=Streptomyces TaxID=1883 RepID=UPI0022499444|nr:GAF and ANTAR domain-containing protein [Streptomyces sp. JHD 1]MCX2968402.1 GAF and ANTAR domain-containing protein [Streptomyces sp. JHD 1]
MTQDGFWQEYATRLAEMSRTLLRQESVQDTLDQISAHAVDLVDGCEHAGVLVVEDRERVRTLSATSELVRVSDRYQAEVAEGPCFDAARNLEEVYRITDMRQAGESWPRYAPRARELGIGSMMGFLLFTQEGSLGSLDVYSSRPNAFSQSSEHAGWVLASHAAVAFSSARSHAQLETALETRAEIGEAIGIVMERYKVSEEQAFGVLRRSSQHNNIKLRDVARTVVRTGQLPGAR